LVWEADAQRSGRTEQGADVPIGAPLREKSVTSAHFGYRELGIRVLSGGGDPLGMKAQLTSTTTLWLNLAMLGMNLAIWMDAATRVAT
jgi:hypothetical protein